MTKSTHALIIDDDVLNLEVIGRLLDLEGITWTKAQDAQQIKSAVAASSQPDLVFLDLEMPQMDGYEAFHLLQNALGSDVPIVACTVHTSEINVVREVGFHSFLAKPLDQRLFPQQVKQILQGESVWEY